MQFRHQFNCCKSYNCVNLGVTQSPDYRALSTDLGYPALHCGACGAYPPLVDNDTVDSLLREKMPWHLQKAPLGCPHCDQGYFIDDAPAAVRYGKTAAGSQRFQCQRCLQVYSHRLTLNITLITEIFQALLRGDSAVNTMEKLKIAPKIYYQQIERIAQVLRAFSRQLELQYLPQDCLRLVTESAIIEPAKGKRLWCLASCEGNSGYALLINHNESELPISAQGAYQASYDSVLPRTTDPVMLTALTKRYQSTMRRRHFEDLAYGVAAPLRGGQLVQPALLAYAHFQMLRPFARKATHLHHYIEHESSIRGAALMACCDEIAAAQAEVFFIYQLKGITTALPGEGNNIGWWSDRWYPTEFGGYCPITYRKQYRYRFELSQPYSARDLLTYVDAQLPALKSVSLLDAYVEIFRTLYNCCEVDLQHKTPAMRLGFCDKPLENQALLTIALTKIGYLAEST